MAHDLELKPVYPLTGIRAAAAIWVVLFHMYIQGDFTQSYPGLRSLIVPVVSHGYLGVDLFFILSGFIIYYNYAERLAAFRISAVCEFLWLRLARLWPIHMAVLGLLALRLWLQHLYGAAPTHPELYTAAGFLRNVFLIHSWAIPARESWNVPAWSISCEWLAYLLFPVLIASRICTSSARLSGSVAVAALVGTALACQLLHAGGNLRYGIIRIAGEFIAGCSLCHLFRLGAGRRLPWQYIVPAAIALVLVMPYYILPAFGLSAYWCVPLLAVIVFGLAYHRCFISRLCSTRLMLFGGYISYSLYMVHALSLTCLSKAESRLGSFTPVVELVVTIAASVLLFYLIEEPCRKRMRNLLRSHEKQSKPTIRSVSQSKPVAQP